MPPVTRGNAGWRLGGLLALTVALAACTGTEASEEEAGGAEVSIATFQFEPGSISIDAGEAVTWTNGDDIEHTVTAGTPDAAGTEFDERLDGEGAVAEVPFAEAGTFAYFCSIHTGMTGTVTVV